MINRLALSGQLRAGKNYIASLCGYEEMGFADPLYEITEYFFGKQPKENIRDFLQYLGQVGWGKVDNNSYKLTPERAVLIDLIRRHGWEMVDLKKFKGANWKDFGKKNTFWVDILLDRIQEKFKENPNSKISICNVRFHHELEPLLKMGFEHFHVMCSEATRIARIRELGLYNQKHDLDTSELFALEMNTEMPDQRIIWNDQKPIPRTKGYLTVEQFINTYAK